MNVASLKSKLKKAAISNHRTFNELLQMYFLEGFLCRLSYSVYREKFTLKGGILLYALFDQNYSRITTDIDLSCEHLSNDLENMKNVIQDICKIEYNDLITYDLENIEIRKITEFKEYHGVNIMIPAFIEKIRGRVNIDVAFGDTIYPAKEIIQYPLLIEKEIPVLYAYSKETIIAEKLHAVVTLGLMNSRLKDFYDLYVLMMTNSFDGIILQNAIEETFKHRNSVFNEILAFETEFIDQYRLQQWKSFLKKKSPNFIIELEDIIVCIKKFSLPMIESIKKNESFNMKWNDQSQNWE